MRRDRGRWTRGVLVVTLIAGGGVLWGVVRDRPMFKVRMVQVAGARASTAAEVRSLAAIPGGVGTWDVDLEAVCGRVLRHPQIAGCEARRWLPDGIVVSVRERRPVAIVMVGDEPYVVDRTGFPFVALDPTRAERLGLARITGLAYRHIGEIDERGAGYLRSAAALVRVLEGEIGLTEVHVDDAEGLTARTARLGPAAIHFGWGRWRTKQRRLDKVLALWAGQEAHLEAVDLAFEDQVVVRLRHGVPVDGRVPAAGTTQVAPATDAPT